MWTRNLWAALALVLSVSAGCAESTYVTLELRGDAVLLGAVTRLALELGFSGRSEAVQVARPTPIAFPSSLNLEIGSGEGRLQVAVSAQESSGGEVAFGEGEAEVQSGQRSQLAVVLGAARAPLLKVAPESYDFARVTVSTHSTEQALQVTNAGRAASGPLTVSAPERPFVVARDECAGKVLAPGAGCEIQVELWPVQLGEVTGALQVSAAPGGSVAVPLRGRGFDKVYWATGYGTPGDERIYTLTTDEDNDVIAAGYSSQGVLIVKLSSEGALLWTRLLPCTGPQGAYAFGVAADRLGNIYMAGSFTGTLTVGAMDLNSAGGFDAFVLSLDRSGAPRWAKRFGDTNGDAAVGVVSDGSDVWVAGNFLGPVDFGSGARQSNGQDIFLVQLSGSGVPIGERLLGGNGHQYAGALALRGDTIALSGEFIGGAGDLSCASPASQGALVAALPLGLGAPYWAWCLPGAAGRSVAVVGSKEVVALNINHGENAAFLIAHNSTGAVRWSKDFTGSGFGLGAVAVDASKNVVVYGTGGPEFEDFTLPGNDPFLIKYNSAGRPSWYTRVVGIHNQDGALAVDHLNRPLVGGFFSTPLNFTGVPVTPQGSLDALILQFAP